uniref:Pectin acetylesterase n=1 Tax=Tanacetum cinerariifolium TaxID=118510 RepID=A0A699IB61_TANCI|nr:hypothetical protein [Tanacetum cinerariifolium]
MGLGMNNAENAILSGCSAGGLAAILNCDRFRGYFPSSTRVKCVPDGGYFAHGSANQLPSGCTSSMKPGLCFYPQYAIQYIKTPVFVMNSAYDTWQVNQLKRLEEFRSEFLGTLWPVTNSTSRGMFINTCFTHCQSETQSAWYGNPTSKLDDKTIAEGVGEWYYDNSEVKKVDTEHVLPHYC